MSEAEIEQAARVYAALGNATRLRAMLLLRDAELCVGYLAEAVGVSQSAVSQHLVILRETGLVAQRRVRTTIYLRASERAVQVLGHQRLY